MRDAPERHQRRTRRRQELGERYTILLEESAKYEYVFIVHRKSQLVGTTGPDRGRDPSINLSLFSEYGSATDHTGLPSSYAKCRRERGNTVIYSIDIQMGCDYVNKGYG
jgi:hypothetical protein